MLELLRYIKHKIILVEVILNEDNNKKKTVAGYKCFEEKLDKRSKGIT